MKRHRSHQIGELARRIFHDALRPSWVLNEQHCDYAKDYLVEIGEDNGDLTGSSFYVQLKGQDRPDITADSTQIRFSLKSKYARYYVEKIKDLPVFLVVVDVKKKIGWWLFLQPVLEADHAWKQKNSVTVKLPVVNDINDTHRLSKAVNDAKKWMRLHHPESIHEAVVAQKERITRTDPRFDVNVSLVNDRPIFSLLTKEVVPLKFTFAGESGEIGKKVSDLLDKGTLVSFQPGEVKITGSRLFEQTHQVGCSIKASVTLTGCITLVCRDAEGRDLARLSEVPGQFTGGRKELWFDGGTVNSPLSIKLGPIASGKGGKVEVNLSLHRWDGQRLMQLAYFDRLNQFFQALLKSVSTTIECEWDGNLMFSVTVPLQEQPFVIPLSRYLNTLSKARKVAQRFAVNPTWTLKSFDRDTQEAADELHGVFFENGWQQAMPDARLTTTCVRETFRFDLLNQAGKQDWVSITSDCAYGFFSEKISVGRLVHDYSQMSVTLDEKKPPTKRKLGKKYRTKSRKTVPTRQETIKVTLVGSKNTLMRVRQAEEVVCNTTRTVGD